MQIEESNRIRKTRDIFKKITYQGNISCKDGHSKRQNWYGSTRSKEIKKRWQQNTEERTEKVSVTQITMNVVTDLEPDFLECEFKWALGRISTNKASGGDGNPAELFKMLNYEAVTSATTEYASKLENTKVTK